MFATRLIQLLLTALMVVSASQALKVDANIVKREAEDIIKRQGTNPPTTRPTTSPSPTSPTTPPTSPSNTPTSTPPTTSPSPSPSSPTTPPTSSPNSPSSTPPPTSDQSPSPTPTPSPSTSTQIITKTNDDGSQSTLTSLSVSSPLPTLNGGQNGGGPPGMTETTRNTIIGVVVGVGGAIILAVIAFVAWRIWGRKRAVDQDDGMTSYSGPTEKVDGSSTTGRSPFQSTLESYHAPTQVNTASNF